MKHQDLYETIRTYGRDTLPMHMPGHKRNTDLLGSDLPYDGDITEISGFDNLHAPEENGILARLSERAAAIYRAKRAFPLVNGTTCGILAAVRALAEPGQEILVARNCHKSVYHAVELTGLRHVSLLPPIDEKTGIYGSIRPADVREALAQNPRVKTVVITSPTYEGVLSDTDAIAEIAHAHGARLLVDAAHGAHLGFSGDFPAFPTSADIAVTSLHKTLPALTQTALALVFSEDTALADRLARELSVFETSSPSYILLASIDRCISLLESRSAMLFDDYKFRLDVFREKCASLKHLWVIRGDRGTHPDFYDFDPGKLMILSRSTALTGTALAERLRNDFSIECEMAYADYVLCMTSICDTDESFMLLSFALQQLDASVKNASEGTSDGASIKKSCPFIKKASASTELPEIKMTLSEAVSLPPAPMRAGEISRTYAWVYPPGVPLIVPGETVTEGTLALLERLKAAGLSVKIGR
ncbi:MAG: aminotransferase class V-fold PLP-dependent enzyme [Clostridia bacterium]|nr:aminotransferase class V-fold PLP-dependent enzyme [Clostridia bacterium]